ncbi:MAG: DUF2256 domain-containing protein [Acidithiobacillus sp.]|nr:DUF2256 domain-containing protein [Acidithiobacillus sp.]
MPCKVCAQCGRPMTWRRSWARCWEEVRYCSHACQKQAAAERRKSRSQRVSKYPRTPAGPRNPTGNCP